MYYGEKLNSISHLVGAVLALIGFGVLMTISIQERDPWLTSSFIIFGSTLILLYTMSTLYHSFSSARLKRVFQKLDHIAIYLLIAGTYTPFLLVSMRDNKGLWGLVIIWVLAAIGLLLDILIEKRVEWLQLSIYLAMGWFCILFFSDLQASIPATGMVWLTIGGVLYMGGVVFYVLDEFNKLRHAHGVWHLFVLSGSISHFISIAGYVR